MHSVQSGRLILLIPWPKIPESLRVSMPIRQMKLSRLLLALIVGGAVASTLPAQTNAAKDSVASKSADATKPSDIGDDKTATELFEEANSYARKKFDAFEKL